MISCKIFFQLMVTVFKENLKENVHFTVHSRRIGALFFLGEQCTHLAAHSSKRLNHLSVTILVCLGNTHRKARLQDKLLHHWSS